MRGLTPCVPSERPQKQVADDVGYGRASALTRAFVRRLGVAPGQWMRQQDAQTPTDPVAHG